MRSPIAASLRRRIEARRLEAGFCRRQHAEPIDVATLQARFAPVPARMPDVVVDLPPVVSYDLLLPSLGVAA
jgi:hypothetical protein